MSSNKKRRSVVPRPSYLQSPPQKPIARTRQAARNVFTPQSGLGAHHLDFKKAKELPYLYINIHNRKEAIKSRYENREKEKSASKLNQSKYTLRQDKSIDS